MNFFRSFCTRYTKRQPGPIRAAVRLTLEPLEDIVLPATRFLDFGTSISPVAQGYERADLQPYTPQRQFGWLDPSGLSAMERPQETDPLLADYHRGTGGTYLVDVPNGEYDTALILGESKSLDHITIRAEGQVVASNLSTAQQQYIRPTFRTNVTDGQLTLQIVDDGGQKRFAVNALVVLPATLNQPTITTPHDTIPNFAYAPTIGNKISGNWSDPKVWTENRVPTTGDVVVIAAGTTVIYDVVSDAAINTVAVQPYGHLKFRIDVSTRLKVGNLLVREFGTLTIGTAAASVSANVTAEIIIANQALNITADPDQYGTGLLVWGKLTMHGAVQNVTFSRLAVEPQIGHTTLTLADVPTNWRVGDRLAIPPTQEYSSYFWFNDYLCEEVTIASISGAVVTLTAPLQKVHPAAKNYDGSIVFTPHVAHLGSNLTVRSESPTGTRGHVFLTDRAAIDIRYVYWKDLGRTTFETTDPSGNHIGRYAMHLHHLWGPINPTNTGHQFTLMGNVIHGARRWGIAVHDSHYGLIKDNVVYDAQLAGFATEDGSESYNLFEHNLAMHIGTSDPSMQWPYVDGYWLVGAQNYFKDNVAANMYTAQGVGTNGFHFAGLASQGLKHFPLFRGADMHDDTQTTPLQNPFFIPSLQYEGNEVYTSHVGHYVDHNVATFIFKDLKNWSSPGGGANFYGNGRVEVDGFTIRNNRDIGLLQPTLDGGFLLKNADIQGSTNGIYYMAGAGPGMVFEVKDSVLRNDRNIVVGLSLSHGASTNVNDLKKLVVRNTVFYAPPTKPLVTIDTDWTTFGATSRTPCLLNQIHVYDYQGQVGNNFRVFWKEQAPDHIVPWEGDIPDDPVFTEYASPIAGLTNAQCWSQHGRAIGGEVSPSSDDTTHPEIDGFTSPL